MSEFNIDSLQNLFNDRITDEVNSITTEAVVAGAAKVIGSTAGTLIGGKIESNIKYRFDNKIKKEIVKKVKLEMKLKKLEKESKLSKEDKNKLTNEIKSHEKNINEYIKSIKDDEIKEDIKEYTKKCEVDYGPKSLYYFSIRIPKEMKENSEDILFTDYIDDTYIKETEDNNSGIVDEFNIGTMLPQCGSTDGVGDPRSITKIINNTNNQIDEDNDDLLSGDTVIDQSIISYINNPDDVYDDVIDESVKEFAKKSIDKVKISLTMRKLLTQRAMLKIKLSRAIAKSNNTVNINEIKRNIIEKENEIRKLKRGLPTQTINEINKLSARIEKEMKAQNMNIDNQSDVKYEKTDDNDTVDNNQDDNTSSDDKDNSSTSSDNNNDVEEKETKESYQLKLEDAQNRNDIDAIRIYENKIKWFDIHEKACNDTQSYTLEAANIEDDIKPIIELLNSKGYKTKYSSSGHTKLTKKSDVDKDGVYYDKLYSDARIMFDNDYNFPKAPKYWMWKTVDGKDYLDIIPIHYNKKDGTPREAFSKWKQNYMGTLKTWVDNLPDQDKSDDKAVITDKKGRALTTESIENDVNEMYNDFFENSLNDLLDDII